MIASNDLSARYSTGTILIHWISVFLIFTIFISGEVMEDLVPADKMKFFPGHAALGIILLILTIIRSFLYFRAPRPEHIKTGSKWNDNLAVFIQRALYYAIILACVFGIATFVAGGYIPAIENDAPEDLVPGDQNKLLIFHRIFVVLLMLMSVMHIVGVFRHIIRTGQNILKRMWIKNP